MKVRYILFVLIILISAPAIAQDKLGLDKDIAYTKAITNRVDKIVVNLGIIEKAKAAKVSSVIADLYRSLNNVYTKRDIEIAALKKQHNSNKDALNASLKALEEKSLNNTKELHKKYLDKLSKLLSKQQVDKVKDGMTYDVLHVTYNGYNNMIQNLTEEQKKQIMAWLVEAREFAMDAESSDKKHAWFGKYKGKINNYLSAAGYDLRKEGEA